MLGDIFGICKEACRKYRCHSRILHAHLDGDGALFGGVELERPAHAVAQNIAERIMAEHDREHEEDEPESVCQELRTHGHDDATHDQHEGWDGTNLHGGDCKEGIYVYVCSYRRPNTTDITTRKGSLLLIR